MKLTIAAGLGLLLAGAAFAQAWQPYSPALVASATAGDPAAQYALGEAYRTGNGIAADREQAIAWFRKAAPGDTRAADALGPLLFVRGERRQAIPLLQAAARRGQAQALYILGTARFNCDYVPRDIGAAYAELRIAAQKGLPEAQRNLARMEPYVTPADRARADALAAQPDGPEAGAIAVPPTPVVRVAPLVPTIRSQPSVTSAAIGAGVPAAATPPVAAPAAIPAQSSPYAPPTTIALPPSRPTATASAPALAPSGGWRIQIAAVASPEAAEREWKRLSAKVPALAALGHAAAPAGALTRLQATGIASRADAGALCQQMVAAGLGCFVVAPGP